MTTVMAMTGICASDGSVPKERKGTACYRRVKGTKCPFSDVRFHGLVQGMSIHSVRQNQGELVHAERAAEVWVRTQHDATMTVVLPFSWPTEERTEGRKESGPCRSSRRFCLL